MSLLLQLEEVCLSYGLDPLLDHVKLQIQAGERICLIGRNGEGKSSLLKIIAGDIQPDSGNVWRKPQLRIARLEQELPQTSQLTVYDFVATGLAETGDLIAAYHRLTESLSHDASTASLKELERLQQEMDAKGAWHFEQKIKSILTRLNLDGSQLVSHLSGGWQRRAALAKALVIEPELLLLDEPTNHLDIHAIQWLEEELLAANCGLLFITHDRALLQRLATRIIELDRGQLTSWPGNYEKFLQHKEELLHAEAKQHADFDKKLAQEERWIRQGIKARRTRNEGRVRALEAMRVERGKRREVQGRADFNINEAQRSGQLVVEAQHVDHGFDKKLVRDFSMRIMRGDRIGLIGPNGIGKSTLLNILLGQLQPDQGHIKLGANLQIAYFDQLRAALDPQKTVMENVGGGRESISIQGKNQHIISYLQDFLFTPARAMTPVKALSGGECNRLLLAKLFSQPANVLVLDEPTNDLDIETLELLEDLLSEFKGTLLLVSHDRIFLDNVVTSTLIFKGDGMIEEHVGGYHDYLGQMKVEAKKTETQHKAATLKPMLTRAATKLSYNEQRELAQLPAKIEKLEAAERELQAYTASAEFYTQAPTHISETFNKLHALQAEIQAAYTRWEELE